VQTIPETDSTPVPPPPATDPATVALARALCACVEALNAGASVAALIDSIEGAYYEAGCWSGRPDPDLHPGVAESLASRSLEEPAAMRFACLRDGEVIGYSADEEQAKEQADRWLCRAAAEGRILAEPDGDRRLAERLFDAAECVERAWVIVVGANAEALADRVRA
jgi:hypothetical protein